MRVLSQSEYKQVVASILFKVDEMCRSNGIQYYLWAGTLLGAVRHNGFIPWDDDIDIAMTRAEYNRLAQLVNDTECGLRFIRPEDNPDTIYSYGKICDKGTVVEESVFEWVAGYGAFIDVFPFDYLPDDEKKRKRLHSRYLALQKLVTHAARTRPPAKGLKKKIAYICTRPLNASKITQRLNAKYIELNEKRTGTLGLVWDYSYPANWFDGFSEVMFEGRKLMTFRNPDAVLKNDYGDYMTLPPESERVPSHGLKCFALDDGAGGLDGVSA